MDTLLIFIALLALLVLSHELGHFLVARWMGITVEEFGFGFPPRILGLAKKGKKWLLLRKEKDFEKIKKKIKLPLYSLNLIPLGGFVKILGEDGGEKNNPNSFASKPVSKRFFVLIAGITMNFILGIFLLTAGHWLGFPELIDDNNVEAKDPRVQVVEVLSDSPAQKAEIKTGDTIRSITSSQGEKVKINKISDLQENSNKWAGEEITLEVTRGDDTYRMKTTPRVDAAPDEGALGLSLARTGIVRYPILSAFVVSIERSINLIVLMLSYLGTLISSIFTQEEVNVELAGPVGIVVLTNQMKEMGWAYLLQFAAFLSINLAFINLFPLPALDGGRIIFLIVEKIKGKPVNAKVEQVIHAIGLYLLLFLMLFISFKDVFRFSDKFAMLWEKITSIF